MNISPLDIRKHEFKKGFRGYDTEEVTTFLDLISMEYEKLITQNAILMERTQNNEVQLKKYHDIEGTLQETLLSAERAREETVKTAKKQAEVIIREAEVKAASIIEDGRRVFTDLRSAILTLKVQKDTYVEKLKALVTAQMEIFSRYSFNEEEKLMATDEMLGSQKGQGHHRQQQAAGPQNPMPE